MTAPPDIAALIAEADAALEFYQPSNIDYMGLVKELRDALEACARDAARFAILPKMTLAMVWRHPLPLLGSRQHGYEIDELRVWCDEAIEADAAIDRARGEDSA